MTGKFAPFWTVGKAGFELLFDRTRDEIFNATQMGILLASGGEFQYVAFFDKSNWNYFMLALQYTGHVEQEQRHVLLYSMIFRQSKVGDCNYH